MQLSQPMRLRLAVAVDPEREREYRRVRRRTGIMLGRAFANACVSGALRRYLDQGHVAGLAKIHDQFAIRHAGVIAYRWFRNATLVAIRREARAFIAVGEHEAAGTLATLWLVVKHRQHPTGHEIIDLIAAWQG